MVRMPGNSEKVVGLAGSHGNITVESGREGVGLERTGSSRGSQWRTGDRGERRTRKILFLAIML